MNPDLPGKYPPAIIGYLTTKVLKIVLRLFFIGMDDAFMLRCARRRIIPKLPAGAFRLCGAEMYPHNLIPGHSGRKEFDSFDHLIKKCPAADDA